MTMQLTSTAFANGQPIPQRFTRDGEDVSPPLRWANPPSQTRSFALVCDDPDAPRGTWVHWVRFNISADTHQFAEGEAADGVGEGTNDFGNLGYGGPAPPKGKPHRYFFKLYALDTTLDLADGSTKAEVLAACKGHILAEAELMGKYQR
ncbi:MAG TPA: YbhB/YbcL family Raf kinase inhibitor-like protein [Gemmataceae bacterium]|nr:YbhB/YbcL family Raf kinase inhibitor-like protein [Gemmataceae bacterium]